MAGGRPFFCPGHVVSRIIEYMPDGVKGADYETGRKEKINQEEMKKISGGHMLWGRTCKICGGVINNDPNTPYDIRCHCNEDSTQSWVPRPR